MVKLWLINALVKDYINTYIDISIVSSSTSQKLNKEYRGIDKATNVIALEYADTRDNFTILTGELILCDSIVRAEANEQGKSILDHYAHMIIHGMLHLQGLDHLTKNDATKMEKLEIKILHELGINNPY